MQYFNQKWGVDSKMVLNKYKEGKAYSFFTPVFVKEILFRKVSDTLCILSHVLHAQQSKCLGRHSITHW